MSKRRASAPLAPALVACLALGAASLPVTTGLGYDPWAWLVWGRELAHLDLHTDGGPSWKPLPALLIAPLSLLGDAAPWLWLALARAGAFAALLFAYRLAARLGGGRLAGVAAALALTTCADVFVTALRGYSEPMLIALLLGAIDRHLAGRRGWALAAAAAGGLLRPEVWPFIAAYGLLLARDHARDARPRITVFVRVGALAAAAPVVWIGLDLLGSGNALGSSDVALTAPSGSAAKADQPVLAVAGHVGGAVIAPVLVLAFVAIALAWQRRRATVLWLAGLALAWIVIVAAMAQAGFPGRRRYLVAAAAVLCVVAAAGLAEVLSRIRRPRMRAAALMAIAVVAAAFAFSPARTDWRLLSLAREQRAQLDELDAAVARAGGFARVRARGRPVINPFLQTALAWRLDAPLSGVRATWSSTPARPRWSPPAIVFRAPVRLAGTRPALPRGLRAPEVARAGRWRVLLADELSRMPRASAG